MLPKVIDILNLRKKYKLSARELSNRLDNEPTFGWINQVENNKIKEPSYLKIKKIYDYFENIEKIRGKTVEGK